MTNCHVCEFKCFIRRLAERFALEPLDLPRLVAPALKRREANRTKGVLRWKLLLCTPDMTEEGDGEGVEEDLQAR